MAQAFVAGIDAILGPQRPLSLVGFSMGGTVAGHAARLLGARVETMVLVGSAGFGLKRGPMPPLRSWRRLPSAAEQRDAHRANVAILMLHAEDKIDDLAVYIQTYGASIAKLKGRNVSASAPLSQCLPDLKGRLASIWGECDATAVPYLNERIESPAQHSAGRPQRGGSRRRALGAIRSAGRIQSSPAFPARLETRIASLFVANIAISAIALL